METLDVYGWGVLITLILLLLGPAIWDAEVIGDGVDLHGTIWFYGWIYDCINNLKNPSFTDQFYYPYGKDIFAHTGNNFIDAALFYPFKLIFIYPYNYLFFIAFILALNTLSLKVLLKNSNPSWCSDVGGAHSDALFSFCAFWGGAGRPTQACLFAAPMAMVQPDSHPKWATFE